MNNVLLVCIFEVNLITTQLLCFNPINLLVIYSNQTSKNDETYLDTFLDAPILLTLDMSYYFQQFNKIDPIEIMPGFTGKFIHTESMTLALWEIKEGSILPLHQHPHEQVSQLISGVFEMTVAGESQQAEIGELITIPAYTEHEGKALSDCVIFDIFSPVREDYKSKQAKSDA